MKVTHVNRSDSGGGAAIAVYRLHQGLLNLGIDSQILVDDKNSDDYTVIGSPSIFGKGWGKIQSTLDNLPLRFYRHRDRVHFSLQWLPSKINTRLDVIAPDLIHLHWIGGGYFPVEKIAQFNRPIVWTLHDMWAFTGGCHYSQQCDRYKQSCGQCPILKSNQNWDFSRWLWQRKAKAWQNIDLTIVTPSKWLAQCANASSLFKDSRIEVIPNGLNIKKYRPIDKQLAKDLLNLPQDKQMILFGAISATRDPRKGFNLLQTALKYLSLSTLPERSELVVFGSSQPVQKLDLGFKTHYLGYLYDELSLTIAYAAADVMVVPSTQEAFGQTASEALACGTPVVGFNATGLQDIVDHQQNGYLATPYDPEALAKGIAWILEENPERRQRLSICARAKIEQQFTVERQAQTYLKLYEDILVNCNATKFK
ncbi:glycosyl transferase group 1 [Stanieria cyanosphaera PCC 7437]|uniref:Glycosyl transferase group 1 n=1 Tax=Stanieria cyanosphaera (strain ATCC 29371 / PCC 7437) TaxID=111780 RepID=K9XX96_STAC7|nr:glycosyltransferase family 4 protein [Stanieria cyanosphaera]AFZ36679.1 glycosyl transferase group 1 [Stanieria cyanosphaera PCC 7437]